MFAVADGETIYGELKHQLGQYLNDEMTLDQFVFWYIPATWNIHQIEHERAIDLTYAIDLRLAEHSNGNLSDGELKELLAKELKNHA